jgi:hypothetical protein
MDFHAERWRHSVNDGELGQSRQRQGDREKTAARFTQNSVATCLKKFSPFFPAKLKFKLHKPCGVAAWPRHARDYVGADRSRAIGEHDWDGAGSPVAIANVGIVVAASRTSGASATNSAAICDFFSKSVAAPERVRSVCCYPSIQPNCRRPSARMLRNGLATHVSCAGRNESTPISSGGLRAGACATSGHAPPLRQLPFRNSRRRMLGPPLRDNHGIGSNECFDRGLKPTSLLAK